MGARSLTVFQYDGPVSQFNAEKCEEAEREQSKQA